MTISQDSQGCTGEHGKAGGWGRDTRRQPVVVMDTGKISQVTMLGSSAAFDSVATG